MENFILILLIIIAVASCSAEAYRMGYIMGDKHGYDKGVSEVMAALAEEAKKLE